MTRQYAHKIDGNQTEIVKALRQTGHQVVVLSRVGDGVPDLLVGRAGLWWLCENKADKGKLDLTPRECRAGRKASHWRIVCGQKGFKFRDYATLEEVRDCIKFFESIQRDAAQEIAGYSEKSHKSIHVKEKR